jgi:hypothetical protein
MPGPAGGHPWTDRQAGIGMALETLSESNPILTHFEPLCNKQQHETSKKGENEEFNSALHSNPEVDSLLTSSRRFRFRGQTFASPAPWNYRTIRT